VRRFFVSLLAFFAAAICGGLVAQFLAEWTRATEEYILVFAATMVIALAITIPFFVAQFFASPRRAVDKVAIWSMCGMGVILLALLAWSLSVPAAQRSGSDFSIIAGLVLPNVTTILAHWLIVRAFQPTPPAAAFGRPATG